MLWIIRPSQTRCKNYDFDLSVVTWKIWFCLFKPPQSGKSRQGALQQINGRISLRISRILNPGINDFNEISDMTFLQGHLKQKTKPNISTFPNLFITIWLTWMMSCFILPLLQNLSKKNIILGVTFQPALQNEQCVQIKCVFSPPVCLHTTLNSFTGTDLVIQHCSCEINTHKYKAGSKWAESSLQMQTVDPSSLINNVTWLLNHFWHFMIL